MNLNYFEFYYPTADAGHVDIVPQMSVNEDGHYTILVGVVAPAWEELGRRQRSITFSIDNSGSMRGRPLRNVQATMCEVAGNLVEDDIVSVVTWNSATEVWLREEKVDGPYDPDLMAVIDDLCGGGTTNLERGLEYSYELARGGYEPDRLNRVILMSDGGANTGETNVNVIASHSEDAEEEGIYLAAVGTSESVRYYYDALMNQVSDAGKGAYLHIDSPEEADRIFGDDQRFLSIMEVAARDVRLSITLPPGYSLDVFHGEEVSGDPSEVEPQHLAPGDAMLYHFVIGDCDPYHHEGTDVFDFTVTWEDPVTRETHVDTRSTSIEEMLAAAGPQIPKADVLVAYAEVLPAVSWWLPEEEGIIMLDEVIAQADAVYAETGDVDMLEIASLLEQYKLAL